MQDRNLTEGLEISSALSSGSYRKVKYNRMRVSRSGMLIVHKAVCSGPHEVVYIHCVRMRSFTKFSWCLDISVILSV